MFLFKRFLFNANYLWTIKTSKDIQYLNSDSAVIRWPARSETAARTWSSSGLGAASWCSAALCPTRTLSHWRTWSSDWRIARAPRTRSTAATSPARYVRSVQCAGRSMSATRREFTSQTTLIASHSLDRSSSSRTTASSIREIRTRRQADRTELLQSLCFSLYELLLF